MESPFPGMDPYLEAPYLWPDVHQRFIVAICDQLQPELSPLYLARIVPYLTMESIDIVPTRSIAPDVAVLEGSGLAPHARTAVIAPPPVIGAIAMELPTRYSRIEIRAVGSDTVITLIEVLSPVKKRLGADAADAYERKRQEVFRTDAHLLEIDLLRGGRRPVLATPWPVATYAVLLSRADQRPEIGIWPLALTANLPTVPIPLRDPDPDVPLDLSAALRDAYSRARYDLTIDYTQPPPAPDLAAAESDWLDRLLRERGLR